MSTMDKELRARITAQIEQGLTNQQIAIKERVSAMTVANVRRYNADPSWHHRITPVQKNKFNPGDKAIIIGNTCNHEYDGGAIVTLSRKTGPDAWMVNEGVTYVTESDISPCPKNISWIKANPAILAEATKELEKQNATKISRFVGIWDISWNIAVAVGLKVLGSCIDADGNAKITFDDAGVKIEVGIIYPYQK